MSKYVIDRIVDGFVVRGRLHPLDIPGQEPWLVDLAYYFTGLRRTPVTVVRRPYCFQMSSQHDSDSIGFFRFRHLMRQLSSMLMRDWTPPGQDDAPNDALVAWSRHSIPFWARNRVARVLNGRIHAEWKRQLEEVDSIVLDVHRAVFAAAFGKTENASILYDPNLYREQYIVKDILQFRAAAIAARYVDKLGGHRNSLEKMADWRSLFAPFGMGAYTSLNKTLSSLPGGVPPQLLCDLNSVVLPRPYDNRLELISTICAGNLMSHNFNAIAHAPCERIRSAMDRIGRFTHRTLRSRRWEDVDFVVRYLNDFPDHHSGGIIGLTEKSIRWHRDAQTVVADETIGRYGSNKEFAVPPIALPTDERIRLIQTVGGLCEEAEQMQHCIASYAERAIQGRCYLFHVSYRGEEASVEVNGNGHVMQSHGPHNRANVAATWGKRFLGRWGKGFPKITLPAQSVGDFFATLNRRRHL